MNIPVYQSASAVFDANGRASVSIGPTVFGIRWKINRLIVSTTSTAETQLRVYRGSEQASRMVDSTYTANQNTSETDVSLATLESLLFVWSGGDVGAIATAVIEGTQEGR